jgi:hypothetical protein
MNWLFDNFQFVLLVAIAFASWLKHRMDTRKAEDEERRAREEMTGGDEDLFEEGEWELPPAAPAPSVPPPLRQVVPPPLKVEFSGVDENQLQRQQDMQERLRQAKKVKAAAREAAVGQTYGARQIKPVLGEKMSLRKSLRDPAQTRRGIILREILGPPVGLR